jgi:XTP/dITP diphosphohydrolase
MRRVSETKLVIASHNPGKVREIGELLAPYGLSVMSAGELDLPEPEETEDSFIGNAELKARAAAEASGLLALADDSGFAVEALDGAPGIYSARWAGPTKDFRLAMQRVLDELAASASDNRRAAFICALTLAWPDGHCESFEGRVSGTVTPEMRGTHGFGYDPLFLPDGQTQTFGEMAPEAKQAMSHRALAFEQLIAACFASAKA